MPFVGAVTTATELGISVAGDVVESDERTVIVSGSFLIAVPNEGEIDEQEAAAARQIAEEGAAGARERGYNATARIAQANESVAFTIDAIAQEIDAGLVVCGQRGRGAIGSALLGSVSHALATHTKRPLLIAPQQPS